MNFAKDLQKLLEKLEEEFGEVLFIQRSYYKNTVFERSSKLTIDLYEKYKTVLKLKLETKYSISNILITNFSNETIRIPEKFIEKKSYLEYKKRYDNLLVLMKLGNWFWDYFANNLSNIFFSSNQRLRPLNINTLEKIRFYMTLVNENPFHDFDLISEDNKSKIYKIKYAHWKKNKSYTFYYKKYIEKDNFLFPHHIAINPIPNYKLWNLNLFFLEFKENNYPFDNIEIFPIQIFENLDGSANSLIGLISKTNKKRIMKNYLIENVSFINNFNIFEKSDRRKSTLILSQPSFYDSYIKYYSELAGDLNFQNFSEKTYVFSMNFKEQKIYENTEKYQTNKTITQFNLHYFTDLSNFNILYTQKSNSNNNPYRSLFKNRYFFPDFDYRANYLFIIKKKKSKAFITFMDFLKKWCYQIIFYELKEKIVIYGYLLPNFDYTKELIYIDEIFNKLEIDYKFLKTNTDIKASNLTIYSLPWSHLFSKENFDWKFDKIMYPYNIIQKEKIIKSQLEKEKLTRNL